MVRLFDADTDTQEQVLELWNECFQTDAFDKTHLERLNLNNLIVIQENGTLVGFAFLLDGGMPYAILDQLYIRPHYRRFTTQRDVFQFAESLCVSRGIKWFYGVLPMTGGDAEKTVDLLARRAQWKATYMGERPMFCRPVTLS